MALPVEIWDSVLESLETGDKLALAMTCSVIHPIARASLWRKVVLHVHSKIPKHRILGTLATTPALGTLVHDLDISFVCGQRDAVATIATRDAGHELLRRLSSLCNLRLLKVSGFVVDVTFCSIVAAQWRQLSTITFEKCIPDAKAPPGTLCEALTNVQILCPLSMEGWSIVAHSKLRKLEFKKSLTKPSSECLKLPFPMSSEGMLTELILNGNIQVDIAPFLSAAPHLRRLTLPDSYRHIKIPPDALQELEYIAGYADCVAPFVCGRPIRAARILLRDTSASDVLRLLERSTTSVTDLEVVIMSEQYFVEIMEYAPTSLCSLSLVEDVSIFTSWSSRADAVALLFLILSRQPNTVVISLRLTPCNWDNAFTEQALGRLSQAFPKLREVVSSHGYYQNVWRRKDGKWTLVLRLYPLEMKTWVSDLLQNRRSRWDINAIRAYFRRGGPRYT